MLRDSRIPIVLWVAVALNVHFAFGVGATALGKAFGIPRFAMAVKNHIGGGGEVEVTLETEQDPESEVAQQLPPEEQDPDQDEPAEPEPEPPTPEPTAEPKPEPPKPELKVVEKKPETPAQPLTQDAKKRIAVVQHVDDPNQENPDAEFIADKANKVAAQTRARITSTDQNDKTPTPGGNHAGPTEAPGNSEETRVAQSEDREGVADRAPEAEPAPDKPSKTAAEAEPAGSKVAARAAPRPRAPPKSPAQTPREAQAEQAASPDTLTGAEGADSAARAREAREAVAAKKPTKKRLPPPKPDPNAPPFGLGALGTTRSGVQLNLSPKVAAQAIGRDRLALERRLDSERRRSAHRGSWKSMGIEKWRAAIENYVPSVRPGNQTALNTARVPFASYLNTVHNRLHPIFADSFLASLDSLPGSHPMNRPEIKTHLEIVLSQEDGRVVRLGVTHTSGVTAFDIAALESVQRGSPYGQPPREIVSPDGNVYFHWEFHRIPHYACSTYFARPYILKVSPKSAPPEVAPPTTPPTEERPPSDERHGGLHRWPPVLETRAALR